MRHTQHPQALQSDDALSALGIAKRRTATRISCCCYAALTNHLNSPTTTTRSAVTYHTAWPALQQPIRAQAITSKLQASTLGHACSMLTSQDAALRCKLLLSKATFLPLLLLMLLQRAGAAQ
jgi:hypothetical protein